MVRLGTSLRLVIWMRLIMPKTLRLNTPRWMLVTSPSPSLTTSSRVLTSRISPGRTCSTRLSLRPRLFLSRNVRFRLPLKLTFLLKVSRVLRTVRRLQTVTSSTVPIIVGLPRTLLTPYVRLALRILLRLVTRSRRPMSLTRT